MEAWRHVWRVIAREASREGLQRLLVGLECNDPRLIQNATVFPPPIPSMQDFPPEAACPVGTLGWADGLCTVREVEDYFAGMALLVDARTGECGAIRHFANFVDEMPRPVMIALLLPECRFALGLTNDPLEITDSAPALSPFS